jgi:hypothetical protein
MANQPIHHSPSFWLIMAGLWAWVPIVCIDNLNPFMALLNPKSAPATPTQAMALTASVKGSSSPMDLLPPIPTLAPRPLPSASGPAAVAPASQAPRPPLGQAPQAASSGHPKTPGLITVGLGQLMPRSAPANQSALMASRTLPVQRRLALATPIDAPAGTTTSRAIGSSPSSASPSDGQRPGAAALGGELSLGNLNETTPSMVPAARIEKLQRESSPDPLSALPRHWRQDLEPLLSVKDQVMPAEVVRLPATHLRQAQTVPITLNGSGQVRSKVEGLPKDSLNLIGQWADRQAKVPEGSLRPVMVVLEPASQLDNEQPSP